MATTAFTRDGGRTTRRPVRSSPGVRQVLLGCGILSSLLYAATDVIGGLQYEGYSFTGQTISELGAIGALSKPFVDPLFSTYSVLLIAFGLGVTREPASRKHAFRVVGGLLAGIGILGLVTAPFSAVHVRGAERTFSDILHIAVISVTVLGILLAVGFGSVALGRRFRVYSAGTLLTLIASGALIGSYGARLAAGQPTPLLGVVERVNVYGYMLWVLVLAIALLRRVSYRSGGSLP